MSLYNNADGHALRGVDDAPGSCDWVREGSTFLKGREFIDLLRVRSNSLANLTRTKRGREVDKQCRAGCNSPESLGHILQACHRTHHTRISRHDNIVRYAGKRLGEAGWKVKVEPHYKTAQGTRIPDLVLTRENQSVILDAQVVGTRIPLSEAHTAKCMKYTEPSLLHQVSVVPERPPFVTSITLNFRGVWAKESFRALIDLGLNRNDIKIITIRCLQGGLRCFRAHHRMTTVI